MMMSELWQRLQREAKANGKKAGLLAGLLLFGCCVWFPMLARAVMPKRAVAATSATRSNVQPERFTRERRWIIAALLAVRGEEVEDVGNRFRRRGVMRRADDLFENGRHAFLLERLAHRARVGVAALIEDGYAQAHEH